MNNQTPDAIEQFASGQTPLSNEAIFITNASAEFTEAKVATLNDVLAGSPHHNEILALVHEKIHANKLETTTEIDKKNEPTR